MTQPWQMPQNEETQAPLTANAPDSGDGVNDAETPDVPGKKKIDKGTAVMFGIFLSGVAMIYVLGVQTKPKPASAATRAADTRLNGQIAQLLRHAPAASKALNVSSPTQRLIDMFYKYPGKESPPPTKLRPHPFDLHLHHYKPPVVVTGDDAAALARLRLRNLARSFAGLRLETILYSAGSSSAMINNSLVQKGSKIGKFTVAAIRPSVVILVSDHKNFALRLPSQ